MIKETIIVVSLLAISVSVLAKKMILPIERVALESDLIVIGKIISVNKETYQFKVFEYIKGKGDLILTVEKFTEWLCDMRYATVDTGQKLFLFLEKRNGKLILYNASTGEIPILNDSITLYNEINGWNEHYEAINYSTSLSQFREGIKIFIRCFGTPNDAYLKQTQIIQKCSNQQINTFIKKNHFISWLYKKLKKGYKIIIS